MVMIGNKVKLRSDSPHWWWYVTRRRMEEGEISKEKVTEALSALISEAQKLPNAPLLKEPVTLQEYWNTIICYLVSGWIRPRNVIEQMERLYISPSLSRARFGQLRASMSVKKGTKHEVPLWAKKFK